jgi:hypothetical protein
MQDAAEIVDAVKSYVHDRVPLSEASTGYEWDAASGSEGCGLESRDCREDFYLGNYQGVRDLQVWP